MTDDIYDVKDTIKYPDFSLMKENFLFLRKRKNKMTNLTELEAENTQLKKELEEQTNELIECAEHEEQLEQENVRLIKLIEDFEKENDKLITENKWYSEQLNEATIQLNVKTQIITGLKELLKELRMSLMFDKDLTDKIDEVLK